MTLGFKATALASAEGGVEGEDSPAPAEYSCSAYKGRKSESPCAVARFARGRRPLPPLCASLPALPSHPLPSGDGTTRRHPTHRPPPEALAAAEPVEWVGLSPASEWPLKVGKREGACVEEAVSPERAEGEGGGKGRRKKPQGRRGSPVVPASSNASRQDSCLPTEPSGQEKGPTEQQLWLLIGGHGKKQGRMRSFRVPDGRGAQRANEHAAKCEREEEPRGFWAILGSLSGSKIGDA